MFKKLIKLSFSFIITFQSNLAFSQNKLTQKKLIEFGWDYPKISFLKANLSNIEKTPFDGVVFSFDFDIYNAFDTIQYPDSKFQYAGLSNIKWKKFTDNFLFVRGTSLTGAKWLDNKSWIKISQNLKKVSKALAFSKAKGIGFDPEYYYNDSLNNPWIYKASLYNNLSYRQVGDYVRKRGKQFIAALQTYKPDVKILCFWLLGLVSMQNQYHPIAETGMALYPFFIEGMLEGKNKTSEIIDGNESSYWYRNSGEFVASGENLRKNGSNLIIKKLDSEFISVSLAQSVFFDGLYAKSPRFEKGFDQRTKERWLRDNLYNAFKTTDKYVWFYNERINWWKNEVDSGLSEIIKGVRNKIDAELNNKYFQVNGKSLILDFKKEVPETYDGFIYTYLKNKNVLQIKLLKNDIKNIQVFKNSRLIYNVNDPKMNFTINLNKKYNKDGNLIISAKDSKGISSVSFVN